MDAYFYILFSPTNKFYVGHTTESTEERTRKHNANHKGFTGRYQGWTLVFEETFPSKQLAYTRERKVKS